MLHKWLERDREQLKVNPQLKMEPASSQTEAGGRNNLANAKQGPSDQDVSRGSREQEALEGEKVQGIRPSGLFVRCVYFFLVLLSAGTERQRLELFTDDPGGLLAPAQLGGHIADLCFRGHGAGKGRCRS